MKSSASHGKSPAPKKRAQAKIIEATPVARIRRRVSIRSTKVPTSPAEPPTVTTTHFEEIRAWARKRGGFPAVVKNASPDEEYGVWIEFPELPEARELERISWEEWYQQFIDRDLVFVCADEPEGEEKSRFFRLMKKE